MNQYIGHPNQIRGVEQMRLQGGRGDGMHLLQVRNGNGLELTVSVDRCADISRLTYKGHNFGFFSPCGYVAPAYYDGVGAGFLKSFTAGFLTTCGLRNTGAACTDEGEALPLHGTVSHIPAQVTRAEDDGEKIYIHTTLRDARIFAHKMELNRRYTVTNNGFTLEDTIINLGDAAVPIQLLYHCNMGYPLLDEDAKVVIPNQGVIARNAHAQEHIATALQMEPPTPGYKECCYYYDVCEKDNLAQVGIFNPNIGCGLRLAYDKSTLPEFVEWKMMGVGDYVLGLEPANCTADGRDLVRQSGKLTMLQPGECYRTKLCFTFFADAAEFEAAF